MTAAPSSELIAAAKDLLDRCRFADVQASEIHARLVAEGPSPIGSAKFDPKVEVVAELGRFHGRYTFDVQLHEGENEVVAELRVVLLGHWKVPSEFTPEADAAEYVASTTGYFAVYPYLREIVQSLSGRLGLSQVILGALPRGGVGPSEITVRAVPTFDHPNEIDS